MSTMTGCVRMVRHHARIRGFWPVLGMSVLCGSAGAQLGIVNNIPGSFTDISVTGTPLNLVGDDETAINTLVGNGVFPAGVVWVGNNGGIAFEPPTSTDLGPVPGLLPNVNAFGGDCPALLPYWSDIGNHSGNVYWKEQGNVLIVQWHQKHFGSSTTGPTVRFQCKVFGGPSTVLAQFIYDDIESPPASGGANASIGVQALNSPNWSLNTALAVGNATVLTVVLEPPCASDFNGDGFSNGDDFDQFVGAFENGDDAADFNNNGFVDGEDFDQFVSAFESGC